MFQELKNRKSERSAEQNMNKTDNPNYEADTHNLGFKESQQMAVRPKTSRLTRAMTRKVYCMTKAGGDPLQEIMKISDSKAQYALLFYHKYKAMGIDRPTIHPKQKISDEVRAGFIADYAAGESIHVICEKHHVSDSAVYHNGVISRKPPSRTPEFKDEVMQMYNEGRTCNEIANHFAVHHDVARRIILDAHPEMRALSNRKFVRLTQVDRDEILKLFHDGMLIGHIAKMTGHSKTTVERIVGHVPNKSYTKHDEVLDQLHTCWTLGYSLRETGRKLNMATSSVKFHFDKFKRDQK
jgi:transposase-like protein